MIRSLRPPRPGAKFWATVLVMILACEQVPQSSGDATSGKPKKLAAIEAQVRQKAAEAAKASVNPSKLTSYSGPVGSIRGVVRVTGDLPPAGEGLSSLDVEGCPKAQGMYQKLFRRGPEGTLADVLVAVTGYDGYLPFKSDVVPVKIEGCAWNARTVALMVGQHLEILNADPKPYMPRLVGSPTPALRVVMPGGAPVPLFAPKAGAYRLVAETRPFMKADVFVVRYPTTDVTDLNGRFEIHGLPIGKATITIFSPAIGIRRQVRQEVLVETGKALELELEIEFSKAEYLRNRQGDTFQSAKAPSPD